MKIPVIQFQEVPFDVAIENLMRQAEINYIKCGRLPNRPVNLRVENVSARTVLTNLLKQERLYLVENPATTVSLISTTNRILALVDPKWIAAGTNEVIPLIQFSEVPLNVAFRELAKVAGHPITVDAQNTADVMVSVRWEKLKARQAIGALVEGYNLTIEPDTATGGVHIKGGVR